MTDQSKILISLKPKYADHIFFGEKTVELRKRRPNVAIGTRVWIYATAPVAAIKGYANVARIETASPGVIWRKLGDYTGLSKKEFDHYFENRKVAHALVLTDIMVLKREITLKRIRELVSGFQPPQFFQHLNGTSERLCLDSRKYLPVMAK